MAALEAGRLPCSGGEGRILRLAASIAGGVAVDLGGRAAGPGRAQHRRGSPALCCTLLATGICGWPPGVSGGEHGGCRDLDPAAAPVRGPVAAGAGQHAPARGLELLVVLPDGSKRLVPASWTDLDHAAGGAGRMAVRGRWARWRTCWACRCWFRGFPPGTRSDREQAARKPPAREDDRAACPAQSAAGPGSGATTGSDRPASRPAGRSSDHAAGGPDRQGASRRAAAGGGR